LAQNQRDEGLREDGIIAFRAFEFRLVQSAGAVCCGLFLLWSPSGARADDQSPAVVHVGYLAQSVKRLPPQPYLDPSPPDEGLAGARLGIDDDNTTGRFTGQNFVLDDSTVSDGGDVIASFRKLVGAGVRDIVVNLPASALLTIADLPEAHDVTLFNAGAPDDELRADKCRKNVLHTLPSRGMLADGLIEYLLTKQWRNIFLVVGPTPEDRAYADAMKRSITKFHARLVTEKAWTYQPGARRSDTGHYAMTAQIASFTQGMSYDVLIVADENDQFGDYISYATYDPRPVAGTHGLVPSGWARPHQEWGATQLQDRFLRLAKRWMTDRDYAAWAAVRSIGEAATRTQSTDAPKIAEYLRGDTFQLGGYKGLPLSYRPWDGQMRQAILLTDSRALVSVSPQQAFLHQFTALDTLGVDQPETKCRMQ
jgi:ABC transporter substrate binding protein (PQQ-dependent alcohol dehydrogenase system)